MAEYFRDEVREDGVNGRDVLFFVDNIYRYTLAGTEVSALLGLGIESSKWRRKT